MRCPVCHSFLSPDDRFCSYCGERIIDNAEPQENVIVLPGREHTITMSESAVRSAEPAAEGASASEQNQRKSWLALGCFAFVSLLVCSFLLFPNWALLVMKPVSEEEVSVDMVYRPFGKVNDFRDGAEPGHLPLDPADGDIENPAKISGDEQDRTDNPLMEDIIAAESAAVDEVSPANETAAADEGQRRNQTAAGAAQAQKGKPASSAQMPPQGNTTSQKDTQTAAEQDGNTTSATSQTAIDSNPTTKEPEAAAPPPEYTITATPMSGTLQVGEEMSFYVTHNFPGAKVYLGQDNFGPELGTYSQSFSWHNLSASFTIRGRSSGAVQIYFFYEDGAGHFIKTPQISINIVDAESD